MRCISAEELRAKEAAKLSRDMARFGLPDPVPAEQRYKDTRKCAAGGVFEQVPARLVCWRATVRRQSARSCATSLAKCVWREHDGARACGVSELASGGW